MALIYTIIISGPVVRLIIAPLIYAFTFISGVCMALAGFNIIIGCLSVVFGNIVLNLTFTPLIYTGIISIIYINIAWTCAAAFLTLFFFSFGLFVGGLNIKGSFKDIVLINITKFNKFNKFGLK